MEMRLPLHPPVYGSMEETFQANLVHKLAWTWIITVTVLCCGITILLPEYWLRECTSVVLISIISIISLLLNKQGHLRLASIVFSILLWLLGTGLAATSGGIKAPVIASYLPVIITAGYLLGKRAGVLMAALCILSSLVFVILDMYGFLPASHIVHTPLSTWVVYVVPVLMVTSIQYWVMSQIRSSFHTIARETAERMNSEAGLKESEEKYRYLFNNNPALIFIWDLETFRLLEVNETALREYGYTRDEILKMTAFDLRLREDHDKLRNFASKMLATDEYKARGIWKHLKKNGELMFMDISSHRIKYKNRTAILSLAENVTEKVRIEEKLKKSYDDIRLLNAHMETVREEERTRIAREIHDELGQQLSALKMDASWLSKRVNPQDKEMQEKFSDIFSLIDYTIKTVRKISSDLRPSILDDLGLQAAMEWMSTEFEKHTGIRCRLDIKLNDYQFEKELCTGVFRVYQEALTNVTRHAGATQVVAILEIDDGQAVLTVKDNGVGFNTADAEAKNTFGLMGMEERAHMLNGELKIESEKGSGSVIILRAPLINAINKPLV